MNILTLEDNEQQFISIWSKRGLKGPLILLYNPNLSDDNLFNHALQKPEATLTDEDLQYVKNFYHGLNIKPTIFILENRLDEALKHLLLKAEFKASDRLITMAAPTRLYTPPKPHIKITPCSEDHLAEWIGVFTKAFSTPSWLNELEKITIKMIKNPNCTLYLARYKGFAVGVATTYRSEGVCGVYCLGTTPQLRNIGVGSSLITYLTSEAYREGDQNICLQTLLSENLTRFYSRLGFKRVYDKVIYEA